MISFRIVCSLTAVVCIVLFGIFLAAPGFYVAVYGVRADASGMFLGNRAAPVFLGLAALCWLLRRQTEPEVQAAVSLSMILIFGGIKITGIWAYFQDVATASILVAAAGECAIAFAFGQTLRTRH